MITQDAKQFIRERIAAQVAFRDFANNRIGVALPLTFGDGDACEVVVQMQSDGSWLITDEGLVLSLAKMHGVGLLQAGYAGRFRQIADLYGAEEDKGELKATATSDSLGDAIISFMQACLQLAGLVDSKPDLKRKSKAFTKRFTKAVEAAVPPNVLTRHWHDPARDPKGAYGVDYHTFSDGVDLLIYGAGSPAKCWKATSSVQHYRLTDLQAQTVFAYNDAAERDQAAFVAMADNATHKFSLDRERNRFIGFLRNAAGR